MMNSRTVVYLLAAVALCLGALLYVFEGLPAADRPFRSERWKEGDMRAKGTMLRDLIESDTLIGRSGDKVVKLLGEPQGRYENLFFYKVEYGPSFWPGDRWTYDLVVRMDSTGTVNEVGLLD